MFRLILLLGLLFFLAYGVYSFFLKHFGGQRNRQTNQSRNNHVQASDPKHFSKDIGEYVSYEEVKDDEK